MATIVTKTIKASGGDYGSRSAFEAAIPASIVSTDEIWQGETDNFSDTTAVTFSGITTDATRYVRLYSTTGAEAVMPYSTSSNRLEVAGTAITNNIGYLRLERQQIFVNGAAGSCILVGSGTVNLRVDRCLLRGNTSNATFGVSSGAYIGTGVVDIINCVTYDHSTGAGYRKSETGDWYIYNSTAIGGAYNFQYIAAGGVFITKNCLGSGGSTACFGGSGTITQEYNASSDTTASGTGSRTSQTFTFVDATNKNYNLASSDAGARDFGEDLSADAHYAFSVDFNNATRSGTWDIGADEYVSSGVSGTLATTLGSITPALSGWAQVTGTFATTLGDITVSASGQLTFSGTLATTLDSITPAINGIYGTYGTLSSTLAGITPAISGNYNLTGTLAASLEGVTPSIIGSVSVNGTLASILDGITAVVTGSVTNNATGTLNITLDGITLTATGSQSGWIIQTPAGTTWTEQTASTTTWTTQAPAGTTWTIH